MASHNIAYRVLDLPRIHASFYLVDRARASAAKAATMMRECVMGIVLYYHFADDGFVFRVRVHELFADEMPTIIRVLTILHGQPVILDTLIKPETIVSKRAERRFWKAAS